MSPQAATGGVNSVDDRSGQAVHYGDVAVRPPGDPADQDDCGEPRQCRDTRPARRAAQQLLLGDRLGFRLLAEPVLDVAAERVSALQEAVEHASPPAGMAQKL